ncbi:hypothetical protein HK097_009835 [Rhizophlyctis rosea]|uniref:Uncharacterized protein n=1 Tax=Rhizophlyctis rosea TaxID=64517 RepID=A0AAD5X8Z3_9FUNG|nr:hypothetical protein HK097_009835 [Rhizophlyctis rosea]
MTSTGPQPPALSPSASLNRLLSDLSKELSTTTDPDPDSESLETLDISKLLKQMDMANSVMDSLETRTDTLLSKLDAMIEAAGTDWDEDVDGDGQPDYAPSSSQPSNISDSLAQNLSSLGVNDTDAGLTERSAEQGAEETKGGAGESGST